MFNEPLYKKRGAGEKLDVVFAFIRENLRTVCRNVLTVAAPFCLLMAFILTFAIIGSDVLNSDLAWLDFLHIENETKDDAIIFISIIIASAVMPMSFTLVDLHYTRKKGITGLKFKDIWRTFLLNLAKWFMAFLPFIIFATLLLPVLINAKERFWAITLSIIVFFFFEMAPPAFIIGKKSYGASIATTIEYAFSSFWNSLISTILLLLVGTLIFLWEIGTIQIIEDFKYDFIGTNPANNLIAYIIFWLIMMAFYLVLAVSITMAITAVTVGIAFQYGSLEERKNKFELKEKIENFEKLKDE